jgi:hypothetical protein
MDALWASDGLSEHVPFKLALVKLRLVKLRLVELRLVELRLVELRLARPEARSRFVAWSHCCRKPEVHP